MTRHRRGPSLAVVRRARERRALLDWQHRSRGMNVYTRTQLGDMARWRQEAQMGHATTDERNTAPLPGQARHYLVEQRPAAELWAVRDELARIDALLDEMGIANLGTRLDRLRNLAQIAKGARDMVALVDRLRAENERIDSDFKAMFAELNRWKRGYHDRGDELANLRERLADQIADHGTQIAALNAEVRRLRAEAGKAPTGQGGAT